MDKYVSGRQRNLKIGISSYSENTQVLSVIGNVGIGSTVFDAQYDLDVRGNVSANSFIGNGSQLSGIVASGSVSISTNTDNLDQHIPYVTSFGSTTGFGATTLLVYNPFTGNLGIGTTNPTSKLQVEGNVFVSGIITSTDYDSTSDINLKKNIKVFENALDKIIQINGVTFDWKKSNLQSAGIIAQDVEKVFPELVRNGEFKTVNYNGLIGVLVESIKELKQEIEELKRKINN